MDWLYEGRLSIRSMHPGKVLTFEDGLTHHKAAPSLIVAGPLEGRYEVTRGAEHAVIGKNEVFLAATGDWLTIVHHAGVKKGGLMGAHWVHAVYLLDSIMDVSCFLQMPLRVDGKAGKELHSIMKKLAKAEQGAESLLLAPKRLEAGFRMLSIICGLSKLRQASSRMLDEDGCPARVAAFVRNNLGRELTVNDLAESVHLSVSRFHSVFREAVGVSPMAFVKRLRLEEAQRYLVSSELSVWEIAVKIGFRNQFHFSREFKERFSLSPLKYRKRHRDLLV